MIIHILSDRRLQLSPLAAAPAKRVRSISKLELSAHRIHRPARTSFSRRLYFGRSHHTLESPGFQPDRRAPSIFIPVTNAIEALNAKLRRTVRARGHFPNDDAAMKLLYLVLNHAAADWKRPPREWVEAKTQFAVVFGERFVIQ